VNGYVHALVIAMSPSSAAIKFGRYTAAISQSDAAWTGRKVNSILKVGDIVYVKILSLGPKPKIRVSLEQDSGAQGALVALDNSTGEIKAMVGGRDFNLSKFNRATAGARRLGSCSSPMYTRPH
jgi:penicillin-binding protein 1A